MTHDPALESTPPRRPARGVGRGFARVAAALLSLILAWSGVGMVLAVAGVFDVAVVAPLTMLVGFLIFRLWPPGGPTIRARSSAVWIAAIVVAVASAGINASLTSERVIGGRDAATYVLTGAWLARDGDLLVEARVGPFADQEDLGFATYGWYDDRADGRLAPQFLHALPALQATVGAVLGPVAQMRLTGILGGIALLAVFGFAQLLVRPWLALLAEVTLAVNLVFTYYARAPFSEVLALLFVFGGLWALWTAWDTRSPTTARIAGLLLGATVMARIDGLVLVPPLLLVLAYERRRSGAPEDTDQLVGSVRMGLVWSLAVAFADVIVVDPTYLGHLSTQVQALALAIAAVILGDVLLGSHIARWASGGFARSRELAAIAAALIVLLMGFLYFARPHVEQVRGSPYLIESVRGSDQVADATSRLFAEDSAHWLEWYLGPVGLALGVAGWAVVTYRGVKGTDRRTLPFLAVFSAATLLYLWRPSVNPDHIWAMRRFLPVALPGLVILAVVALDALRAGPRVVSLPVRRGVMIVGAVGLLGGSLLVTAPVALLHEFAGLTSKFEDACATMGDEAAVLIIDPASEVGRDRLTQVFRSVCGVPAAFVATPEAGEVAALAEAWRERGRELWLVSADAHSLRHLAGPDIRPLVVGTFDVLELTLLEAPQRTVHVTVDISGARALGP